MPEKVLGGVLVSMETASPITRTSNLQNNFIPSLPADRGVLPSKKIDKSG